MNLTDPWGLCAKNEVPNDEGGCDIVVTGKRLKNADPFLGGTLGVSISPVSFSGGLLPSLANLPTTDEAPDTPKVQNATPHCPNGGYIKRMLVTGYTNGFESTGKNPGDRGYGVTTDGSIAGSGTAAAPRSYPFGTQMYVPGYGAAIVHDRGGAIKNAHIDVWFGKLADARQWGAKYKDVEVCN